MPTASYGSHQQHRMGHANSIVWVMPILPYGSHQYDAVGHPESKLSVIQLFSYSVIQFEVAPDTKQGYKKMKKISIMKFFERAISCFVLMVCLQGCENTTDTTRSYYGIAAIALVIVISGIVIFFDKKNGGETTRGCGITVMLFSLVCVVFTTLSIISYFGDNEDIRLIEGNPKTSSCLNNPNRGFSKTYRINTVKRPFIVIRKEDRNVGWIIIHYSEKKRLDENAVKNLNTVIVARDVLGRSHNYYFRGTGPVKARGYTHNVQATYFDLINNQYSEDIIGYEGPIPEAIESDAHWYVDNETIINAVKMRSND